MGTEEIICKLFTLAAEACDAGTDLWNGWDPVRPSRGSTETWLHESGYTLEVCTDGAFVVKDPKGQPRLKTSNLAAAVWGTFMFISEEKFKEMLRGL
jgi:hypothetical protein